MLGYGAIGEYSIGEYSDEGVIVTVPLLSEAVVPQTPSISSGVAIGVPTITTQAVVPQAPEVNSGSVTTHDSVYNAITPWAPSVSISATISPPVLSQAITPLAPILQAGISIVWKDVRNKTIYIGGIGEGSIGEFSIGEGVPSVVVYNRVPTYMVRAQVPQISAGKSIYPGTVSLTSVPYIIEIGARRRKLRTLAMAS